MNTLRRWALTFLLEFEPFPTVIAALQSALMALGTGECQVNQCEGCKYENQEAAHQIRDALTIFGVEPWSEEKVNLHSAMHLKAPSSWNSQKLW